MKLKCFYCGKSDGNDDIIVNREVVYINETECQINETKQCDICGKKYTIEKHFSLEYERFA